MAKSIYRGLTQLGRPVRLPDSPDKAVLERVRNPHPGKVYLVRFTAPEFTALCPITGQPDFAHLVIDYAPRRWLVESKSLKLYLAAFRNHGAFHEDCTMAIGALEREVLTQFLVEAVVLSSLGGLIGIVLALAGSLALAQAMQFPFVFSPGIVLLAFGFAAAVGVVFGYFPARKAASLDPIEALRHE